MSSPPLARRLIRYLELEGPKWAPQIAARIEGGPLPVPTIEAALRFLTATGLAPLYIVPKRGYTLCTSLREIEQAKAHIAARITDLRRWQEGLERAHARIEADTARRRAPQAASSRSRP